MLFIHPLFAGVLLTTATLTAAAQSPLTGCAAKQYEIRQKQDQARAQQQHHQAAGLEKALHAAQAQCSDSRLQHSRRKVEQAQQEVRERQADLQDAQRQGDAQKILKRQNTLNQAHQERQKAKRQQQ